MYYLSSFHFVETRVRRHEFHGRIFHLVVHVSLTTTRVMFCAPRCHTWTIPLEYQINIFALVFLEAPDSPIFVLFLSDGQLYYRVFQRTCHR